MQSRLLYITTEHLIHKVKWVGFELSTEWIYCGLTDDFKQDLVSEHLKEHFGSANLYLVLTRTGSHPLAFEDALSTINKLITDNKFCIWNTSLTKVMEFDRIGVFRKGSCAHGVNLPHTL